MTNELKIDRVFKKERGRLLNFIRKRVPSQEDAEDILHDVFFRLMENFAELDTIERITLWLFASARNRITDGYRKNRPDLLDDVKIPNMDGDEPLSLADILPDTKALPDRELIINYVWDETESVLNELPEEQRDVFVLNEFGGYSYKEISEMLKLPVNTLLSRKRYAVLYLRKRLQNLYKEIKNEY